MTEIELFTRFGIALAIGFLIGLQREVAAGQPREESFFAGVRTFPLLSLIGCGAALLSAETGSPWPLATAILLTGLLVVAAYTGAVFKGHHGITTEAAAILMVLIGAICYQGKLGIAVAVGVALMALLSLKGELHQLAGKVTREDVIATLKFGAITAIVLPVLPNSSFGSPPFDVLNPYKIWLMVVLISGLSFLGYLLIKVVGASRGIGITGFLGGLVSSTAVTLTFAERSRTQSDLARVFAVAVTVAWTTMFARVMVEVAVVNRALLTDVWVPMAAAGGAGLVYALFLFLRQRGGDEETMEFSNPFELGPAIGFGLLYGVILLVSRLAQTWLGTEGVYASAVLAGLTDVDAITLSMAELSQPGAGLDTGVASRAITLAAMSNTVVKGGIVLASGGAALKRAMLPGFLLILVAGLGAAFLL
ncbi:MAG: MgtC/SapB family protein [bacterium]|nr:MgtC/SapB family protein [bacterium]